MHVDLHGADKPAFAATVVFLALLALIAPMTAQAGGVPAPVTCALPYSVNPLLACSGKHIVQVGTGGYSPNQVTVQLIGYDAQGATLAQDNVLSVLPVKAGYTVQLTSQMNPTFWKFSVNNFFKTAQMVAPIPVLKVSASDGVHHSEAYCSNVPLLNVLKPDGTGVGAGGSVDVVAMIPRVSDQNLKILVDGVDLFGALVPARLPTQCTPAAPCNGTATINGQPLTISNLIVDNASTIAQPASNTVTFTMSGLACGGHSVQVQGQSTTEVRTARSCYQDDLKDAATANVFTVNITSPADGAANLTYPVTVTGEACHGRPITVLDLNGKQTIIPSGDLIHTSAHGADTYKYDFSQQLGQTNLGSDFLGTNLTLGTLDLGSNRLVATATDDLGNRVYDGIILATGNTANPGIPAGAVQNALAAEMPELRKAIQESFPTTLDIDNAFLVTLSQASIQKQFDKHCVDADQAFRSKVHDKLVATTFPTKTVDPGPCSTNCDVTPAIDPNSISFTGTASCPVQFQNGKIHITFNLPDVHFTINMVRSCGDCGLFDTETDVDLHSAITLTDLQMTMDISANDVLTGSAASSVSALSLNTQTVNTGGVSTPCFVSGLCDLAITIGTLGIVNLMGPIVVDVTTDTDFQKDLGATKPDPLAVQPIGIDPSKVSGVGQTVSGALSHVSITPDGLVAGLKGTFATDSVGSDIVITPGAVLSPPTPIPLPLFSDMSGQGIGDVAVLLSDDTFNMFFASMALSGKLETSCQDSGKTLADVIPDCETITLAAGDTATALARGACHALKGDVACESLSASTDANTAVERGACHGSAGDNCSTIVFSPPIAGSTLAQKALQQAERLICTQTPALGLTPDMPLLMCSKQDIPPRPNLLSGGTPNNVPMELRLKDLSVALVVDRNKNKALDGDIKTLPSCFARGLPAGADCAAYELCLAVNLDFAMGFQTCADGSPGFTSQFKSVQVLSRQVGTVCGGSGAVGSDTLMTATAGASDGVVTNGLGSKGQDFAPPICVKGLSLGGQINCASPKLVSIADNTHPSAEGFKDFLGITCSATCTPTTCATVGALCGSIGDGCGGILDCGTCTGSQTCGGGGTPNVCGCTPKTCALVGANCGTISDGCGGTLSCGGACTAPNTCGANTPNVCGCTPTVTNCAAAGKNCGSIPNGCGHTLDCGTCSGSDTCGGGGTPNVCGH